MKKYPLLSSQLGVFLHCVSNPESVSYNLCFAIDLSDDIDFKKLADAWKTIISKKAVFRTRFETDDKGNPLQYWDDNMKVEIPIVNLPESEFESFKQKTFLTHLDILSGQPLFNINLVQTEKNKKMVIVIHHVLIDFGTVVKILNTELAAAYDGQEIKEDYGVFEVAENEEKEFLTDEYKKSKDYVCNKYKELNFTTVNDYGQKGIGETQYIAKINKAHVDSWCRANNIKPSILFQTAFTFALNKFSGDDTCSYLGAFHGRTNELKVNSYGMFVNLIPMSVKISSEDSVKDFFAKIAKEQTESYSNCYYPINHFFRDTGKVTNINYNYLASKLINRNLILNGNEYVSPFYDAGLSRDEFSTSIWYIDDDYLIRIRYSREDYSDELAKLFVDEIKSFICNIIDDSESLSKKLSEIPLVSEEEKEKLFQLGQGNLVKRDSEETVLSMFKDRVQKTPDATAVVFKDKKLSYAELDNISDKLAIHLHKKFNIQKEDNVGILINRSELMLIYPLAIMKNAAAYMPLDPTFPQDRLDFMCRDAGVKLILSENDLVKKLIPDFTGNVFYSKDLDELPEISISKDNELISPSAENRFVVLFTSGSTGTPKGVELEHHNIVNFCHWYAEYFKLTEKDKVSAYANFGFDAHMMDIYPAILAGAPVYIMPDEIRKDVFQVNEFLEKEKITVSFFTTQVGCLIRDINKSLRVLSVGGEKLPYSKKPAFTFVNGYGPTECTIYSSVYNVYDETDGSLIGRPVDNYILFIVDKNLNLLPEGMAGELLICGEGVGRGYLNRPELTAEKFVNFNLNGKILRGYRSGDLVRWSKDGNIEYIGRMDKQVKLRGLRIELGEIESRTSLFDSIKQVAVDVKNDQLCCYYVSKNNVQIDQEKLKSFLAEKLTDFMIPEVYMQLDQMPLNPNGKIDRKKLPEPEMDLGQIIAPETEKEKQIFDIMKNLIGTDKFGVTTNLVSAGLSSIKAMKASIEIYKQLNVEIKISQILKNPTIREIIALTENNSTDESKSKAVEKNAVHLSNAQQGVYADCIASPDALLYNIPACYELPDGYTADQVIDAIKTVINCHPSMKTRFYSDDSGEVLQEENPEFKIEIPVKKMSQDEFNSYKQDFIKPFNLLKENLVRFEIVQIDKMYLLCDFHHTVFDGYSLSLFMEQFVKALDGVAPEKENYTFIDFIKDEKITAETESFFEKRLGVIEESTQLISDIFKSDIPHEVGKISVPTDFAKVEKFAEKLGVTPANVYLAATFITISRFVCEDTVSLVTISNGRSNLKIHNTTGMFVNTLPLVENIDSNTSVANFVKKVSENFIETIQNENYPFAKIAKKFDFRPNISFAYQVGVIEKLTAKNGQLEFIPMEVNYPKIPVGISVANKNTSEYSINVDYDISIFSKEMMNNLAVSIENVVQGLMTEEKLKDISLTNSLQWKILDTYNRPFDLNFDSSDTIISLFKKNVKKHPDKVAGVFKDKSYTYKQLDELTDKVASVLYKKICAETGKTNLKETTVSILINRSENVFILPLSVLKTGCGYEPLDPSYPEERLNFMVEDAGAVLLIAEDELSPLVSKFTGPRISPQSLIEEAEKENEIALPNTISPHDIMIMLYTSGSTGVPKGVQIEHGNMVAYAYGINKEGIYTEDSITAAYASFGFDVCMSDTFNNLLNGGTVNIIPEEIRMELDKLAAYFDESGITNIVLTTQVGVQFLQNFPQMKTLKHLIMGGEKLPSVDPSKLNYHIYNGYGPTENCCGVSTFPIQHWEQNIPIGKPFPSIHAFVLDKTGHRLPAGAAGEYCLSGPQVSRGYLNRPDKTAESYQDCPFNEFRMYHTGDIVRYRENGDVEFVGRKDGQVKIRGFRVETKEVEAVIRQHESVKDVTVQAYSFEGGGKYLAAFIVSDNQINVDEISSFIKSQKPAYMVPSVIMQIPEIPLTVNQKVDKKALPKPVMQQRRYEAPVGKIETDFCEFFAKVTGVEKVGALDDFFEIGGSSILAMKVVLAAMKAGYSIVYQDVFTNTTPRSMASYLGEENSSSGNSSANNSGAEEKNSGDTNSPFGKGFTEIGPDGYDYSKINELLRGNTIEAFKKGERQKIGDVLLAGPTGYLGIHMLKELIDNYSGKIYCVVRSKGNMTAKKRLQYMLFYYFENDFEELFDKRIFIVEGDITNADTLNNFAPAEKSITVINCAACVKHFAPGDLIEKCNVESVKNLIAWCKKNNARLVHVSTGSVVGATDGSVKFDTAKFDEHMLYVGQIVNSNQYIHSKFMAERLIYEAILKDGLNAKVMRAGNLAPRDKDGEFQINAKTNSAMSNLNAFKALGKIAYEMMDSQMEFSPIDCVAKAMLLLATTPKECVCFMPSNHHRIHMGDVVMHFNSSEEKIKMVELDEFKDALQKAIFNPELSDYMRPLMAYTSSNEKIKNNGYNTIDVNHTVQVLYRLRFRWPEISPEYVKKFINALSSLGLFYEG